MRLKHLFRIVNGATPSPEPVNWHGNIAWATPVDIGSHHGLVIERTERSISDEGLKSCAAEIAPAGSLLLSTRAPIGYVAESTTEMAINQGCRLLVPRTSSVDSAFYRYVLCTRTAELQTLGRGSTFVELSTDDLGDVRLPAPEIAAQRAIVRFLDKEMAKIDVVIEKKLNLVRAYQEFFDSLTEELIAPESREKRPLRRVSGGVTVGVVVNPSTYVQEDGTIPFFRGVDVSPFRLSLDAQRISTHSNKALFKSSLRTDDIVSIRVGEPGVSAVVPPEADGANCASLLITRSSEQIDPRYLCFVYNSPYGRAQFRVLANGAAQLQVNVSDFVDFQVPIASLDEQKEIADRLDFEWRRVVELQRLVGCQIEVLNELRAALITAGVTEQVDVGSAA